MGATKGKGKKKTLTPTKANASKDEKTPKKSPMKKIKGKTPSRAKSGKTPAKTKGARVISRKAERAREQRATKRMMAKEQDGVIQGSAQVVVAEEGRDPSPSSSGSKCVVM